MTQKELLYVEDAIGHEKNIIAICNDIINNLSDEELISFMKKEAKRHSLTEEKLTRCLEEKCNE